MYIRGEQNELDSYYFRSAVGLGVYNNKNISSTLISICTVAKIRIRLLATKIIHILYIVKHRKIKFFFNNNKKVKNQFYDLFKDFFVTVFYDPDPGPDKKLFGQK